jgi:uncharacterized membrane protein AbrB (regulator of aidB expression)
MTKFRMLSVSLCVIFRRRLQQVQKRTAVLSFSAGFAEKMFTMYFRENHPLKVAVWEFSNRGYFDHLTKLV